MCIWDCVCSSSKLYNDLYLLKSFFQEKTIQNLVYSNINTYTCAYTAWSNGKVVQTMESVATEIVLSAELYGTVPISLEQMESV